VLVSLPSAKPRALGKHHICRVPIHRHWATWLIYRVPGHSANRLPSARDMTLGKVRIAVGLFAECSLPSVTLGKYFAECNLLFAECN